MWSLEQRKVKERQEPFDVCLFVATFDLSCGTPAIEKKRRRAHIKHTQSKRKRNICFVEIENIAFFFVFFSQFFCDSECVCYDKRKSLHEKKQFNFLMCV